MNSNSQHTISVTASTNHLAEVREFVANKARNCGFSDAQISDIRLAVDEAFTNIIKHAYHNHPDKKISLVFKCSDGQLQVSLFDSGASFAAEDYHAPDVEKQIKQKKRGGVGVYLIKQLMDKVEYLQRNGHNEIRMLKKR